MCRVSLPAISRYRTGVFAGALAVSLLASSCMTVTTAPSDSRLSGHWVLDPAASDDASARITQALAEVRKKMRARRQGGPGGPGDGTVSSGGGGAGMRPEGGDDALPDSIIDQYGNTRQLGPDLRALTTNLIHAVASPRELELAVEGDTVRVRNDGLPAREYHLGEGFSRFDEYGTARMLPSWSGDAFVLRARYANGASITERYEVIRGQSVLTRTVDLIDPVLGKLQLHAQYRAAPH
jgi:hypothetical protein